MSLPAVPGLGNTDQPQCGYGVLGMEVPFVPCPTDI